MRYILNPEGDSRESDDSVTSTIGPFAQTPLVEKATLGKF
jgi:hypothetical protein